MTEPLVSLEYAHTVLDPTTRDPQLLTQALASTRLAELAIDELTRHGFRIQTCVLLDDKYLSPALDRDDQAEFFLDALSLTPDVAVFESDLKALSVEMVKAIEEPRHSKLARELESRAARGLQLACSVDITIWHLLRLGYIPSPEVTRPLPAFVAQLEPADYAISILPAFESSYEERAFRDNLTSVPGFKSSRLRNFYFETDEDHGQQRARLTEFITSIGKDGNG